MKTSAELVEKFLNEAPLLIIKANKQFSGLSESQIIWKPSEDKWSIGECIEHLVITQKLYNSEIKKLQFSENPIDGSFRFKHTFSGQMILKYVDPDSTSRSKTFKIFKPDKKQIGNKDIIKFFCEEVETMISFAEKLKGADLTKLKIRSPLTKLIKMNVGDALLINLYHNKRHLNQAEKILNNTNFPK